MNITEPAFMLSCHKRLTKEQLESQQDRGALQYARCTDGMLLALASLTGLGNACLKPAAWYSRSKQQQLDSTNHS